MVIIYLQIIISLSLIGLVLVQRGGKGLSKSFSSGGSFARRGLERLIFRSTFVLLFLFIALSIYQLAA